MLREFVLPDTDILASSFNSEELTDSRPELVFPRDEVIFYAVMETRDIDKSQKSKVSRIYLQKPKQQEHSDV